MELRFITFNSIMHINLMPWLTENQDEEKFRLLLWQINKLKINASMPFLTALPYAFDQTGIAPGQKLKDEWFSFTRTSIEPGRQSVQSFLNLDDTSPRLIFYSELIADTTAATLSLIANLMAEDQSADLHKHRIMSFMKTISDMILSARTLYPGETADGIIINRLIAGLAILYSEIMMHYPSSVEPLILKVSKTDIRNILQTSSHLDENTRLLYHALSERYYPVIIEPQALPPVAVPEPQRLNSLPEPHNTDTGTDIGMLEVVKMQDDLKFLKVAIAGIAMKKESLSEKADYRIGSAEVCRLLQISKSTLKEHREKKFFSFNKIGSRYNYSANEINELLKLRK